MSNPKDHQSEALVCPYRPSQPESTTEQSKHPFIAFKHFIDDQVRAVSRLTSISELRKKMQTANAEQSQHEREAHFRWTGRDVSPDYDEMVVQRMNEEDKNAAFDAALMLVRESSKRNASVDPATIEALYRDNDFLASEQDRFAAPMLSFGGACYYMPETGDNLPSTASLFGRWLVPAHRFLSIDWFRNSAYSPINIRQNPAFDEEYRETTMQAFEDLLTISLSKPLQKPLLLGTRPNYMHHEQYVHTGPGLDWMLSLYCRGILPLPPSLQIAKRDDNFGVLERVRQHWPELAGSWAPSSPEKEFAELVRAVASPPAARLTPVNTLPKAVYSSKVIPASLSVPPARPSASQFFEGSRSYAGFFSNDAAREFWHAIYNEDADKAAKLVIAWEGKGRDVEELIDDACIVEDYLEMDTAPELWPLCEALEKSHSELLFQQAIRMSELHQADLDFLEMQQALENSRAERSANVLASQEAEQRASMVNSLTDFPTRPTTGVLAALTTTHTTRLPDGSVTTKVVLKQRFADGREETTESVKVEYPEQNVEAESEPNKKRSWFWS